MKAIFKFIQRIINPIESPKPLGRWGMDYCSKKTNFKVDLANEDHCGPCGQYGIEKVASKQETLVVTPKIKSS